MRWARVLILLAVTMACSGADDTGATPDASVDGALDRDAVGDNADGASDSPSDLQAEDGDRAETIDVIIERDASTADAFSLDVTDDGSGEPSTDHLDSQVDVRDGADFGPCTVLPGFPPSSATEARLWFSTSEVRETRKGRARGDVIYGAGNPPFRLDARSLSLCLLPGASGVEETTQDILAPPGTSLVVVAFGSNGPRVLRVSIDDGRTWTTANGPEIPAGALKSLPTSLAAAPAAAGVRRLFATYGGTTLDVSENDGRDWTRVIEGSSTPADGFTVDSAGDTLWFVSEAALDRVVAYWIPIDPSQTLPSSWNFQRLASWDSNGVYSAVADPFDPHAIYLGGEGRLGYLTVVNGTVNVDLPWVRSPTDSTLPYTYATALWADPGRAKHIIWGGGQQGPSAAHVFESDAGGRDEHEIPLEGAPQGFVTAILHLPALSKLIVMMQQLPDTALAAYVIDR